MTIREFFSFQTNKYFWVNIVAMMAAVGVILFMVLKGLDIYTRHGEAIVVPDVKGLQLAEAEAFLHNHGLSCIVSDSSYVKNKPAGCVLELTPAAGQKVKEGRAIYLTINSVDVPLRTVPDVADNSSVRQAQAKVQSVGFKLTENQLVSGEKDWVYGVKYQGRQLAAGEKVPAGATLTLMVGNGEHEVEVTGDSLDVVEPAEEVAEPATTEESWF
ncbi:MAG: PASTA domain-containing protein [Bacteroides sp.]